ncbi:MAG: methyltransferase domain-containing protein [Pirellulales bacterium]|nr:methyltransferase domain-containing protein [Pirellulales bacterium]
MPPLALTCRRLQGELMDQADLDEREHGRALKGLARINVASRTCQQFWRYIDEFARRRVRGAVRILDVASGGGDVAFGLWKIARRRGVALQIVGLDLSPTACRFAAERCRRAEPAIEFHAADVIRDELPGGFDVAMSALFLHHLSERDCVTVLRKLAAAAPLVLASDLRRSTAGYLLAHVACRALSRSPIVHFDGPQSVRNAYSLEEMKSLCAAAGLPHATVRPAWPCRLVVRHQRRYEPLQPRDRPARSSPSRQPVC